MNKLQLLLLNLLCISLPLNAGWFFRRTPPKPVIMNVAVPEKKIGTIMLDPTGDAQHPGRIIFDTYEHGIALQFAQELKKALEQSSPVRVIITRSPGEIIEPLQQATFANRIDPHIYISFHFYQEKEAIPHISCYYFVSNPITDFWHKQSDTLACIPFDQAHKKNLKKTVEHAKELCSQLKNHPHCRNTIIHEPIGIPFKPLLGIQSPACAFEIGLTTKDSWRTYVAACAASISSFIKQQDLA